MAHQAHDLAPRPPLRAEAGPIRSASVSAARLAHLAALMSSCATLGLLAACGGGNAGADSASTPLATTATETAAAATTGTAAHGRVSIQAAAATVTGMTTPIVASALGACTQAVSSSWDVKLGTCSDSSAQSFVFHPVTGSSGVYTIEAASVQGACLKPGSTRAGAYVELDGCDASTSEQFQVVVQADGQHVELRNIASGLCLVAATKLNVLGFFTAACSSSNANEVFSLTAPAPAPAPAPTPAPAPAPTPAPAPAPTPAPAPAPTPAPTPAPAPAPAPTPAPAPAPAPAPGSWFKPTASTTWNWQLTGTLDTTVNATVYDIDLYDNSAATIAQLKAAGHQVVCYFSAGSAENWRADYAQFLAADKGKGLDGWPGEYWLDTRSTNVRNIMAARLDLAKTKGCDGVEPDNVDGYTNSTGLPLTAATQLDYNQFLATQAHARGLGVALKNDVDQVATLAPSFDFAINEQCNQYTECGGYTAFTSKNKPVFNAEYATKYVNNTSGARDKLCAASRAANIRTLVLPLDLDGSFRDSCD